MHRSSERDEYTVAQFQTAIPLGEHEESEYYGPYNTLLTCTSLFPKEEYYMVVPQYRRSAQLTSIDFTAIFVVQQQKCPVFSSKSKQQGIAITNLVGRLPMSKCGKGLKT